MTIGKRRRNRTEEEVPAVRETLLEETPAEELPAEERPEETPPVEAPQEAPGDGREQLAREREDFEREKAKFARLQMVFSVEQALRQQGLPAEFAPWLAGETPEESAERMDAFVLRFQEAVSAAVTRRMRGQGAPREPRRARGYSREELRNLSRREINAHWEEIQRTLKH